MNILIKNGNIWSGEGSLRRDMLLCDGRIAEISEKISSADEEINADGCIVSHGLVDIHAHLKGLSCDYLGADKKIFLLPFGTTTAADSMCDAPTLDKSELDSDGVKTYMFAQVKFENNIPNFKWLDDALSKYEKRVIGVKIFGNDQGILDASAIRRVSEYANSLGLRAMVHSTDTKMPMSEVIDALSTGDILTHAYHGGMNSAADEDFAPLLTAKEKGIVVDAGIEGASHTDLALLKAAAERGIFPDTVSTDLTCHSHRLLGDDYGLTLCMSIFRSVGMAEKDIFAAVTTNAAKAIGLPADYCRLNVGDKADIAIIKYEDKPFSITDKNGNIISGDKSYVCKRVICG